MQKNNFLAQDESLDESNQALSLVTYSVISKVQNTWGKNLTISRHVSKKQKYVDKRLDH